MKRKFLKVALLAMCALSAYSCQQNKQSAPPAPVVQTPSKPVWNIGSYIDEFGRPTGFKYVYADATGTFTNSATTNGELGVQLIPFEGVNIHGDTLGNVSIKLLEYGRSWVKGKGAMYISVMGNDGTIVRSICLNDDRGETTIRALKNDFEADSIFNLLLAGGKVMFSMETAKAPYSSYKFILHNADGLRDVLDNKDK